MKIIYQPIVIEYTEIYLQLLINSDTLKNWGVTDFTYAKEYISNKLTEKFINNGLDNINEIFDSNESLIIIKDIIIGSMIQKLKDIGYVNSYEDENTEEHIFLTEAGKKYIKTRLNTPI